MQNKPAQKDLSYIKCYKSGWHYNVDLNKGPNSLLPTPFEFLLQEQLCHGAKRDE